MLRILSRDLDQTVFKMAVDHATKKNLWKIWFCTLYRVFAHLGFFNLREMYWGQKKGGKFGVSYPLI